MQYTGGALFVDHCPVSLIAAETLVAKDVFESTLRSFVFLYQDITATMMLLPLKPLKMIAKS